MKSRHFIAGLKKLRKYGRGPKSLPTRWDVEPIKRYDLTPGECVGCFNPADRHHATGWPCCLSCYGADLIKLAKAKIRYCKKALAAFEDDTPDWIRR